MNEQPKPEPNGSKPIWELVIEDMATRDLVGRKRYGVPLQANNGRDALQDAYEEALDLAVYLRQAIEERKNPKKIESWSPGAKVEAAKVMRKKGFTRIEAMCALRDQFGASLLEGKQICEKAGY